MPDTCPIFLINLDRATDRLARAAQALRAESLTFERVAAVDGAQLNPATYQAMTAASVGAYHDRLTPGELGCYLSHVHVLTRIVTQALPVSLVLEDDFEVIGSLRARLESCVALGDRLPDVVKLFGVRRHGEIRHPLYDGIRMMRSRSAPAGTVAVLWTFQGARRFLAQAMPPRWPIDIALKHWWTTGLEVCWVTPPVIGSLQGPSTIGRRRSKGLRAILRRRAYRTRYAVAKEWRYLARYGLRAWLKSHRFV